MPGKTPQRWPLPAAPRAWLHGLALGAAFACIYGGFGYLQFYHWLITDGLLFAMLWLFARGWWPWLFGATILARIASGAIIHSMSDAHGPVFGYWADWPQFVLGNLLEPFLVATGVLALKHWNVRPGSVIDARAITRLHLAAAISALAVVCKDALYVLNDGFIADVTRSLIHDAVPIGGPGSWELLLRFSIKNFMGCFVGILMIAPLAFWLASPSAHPGSHGVVQRAQRLAVPAALLFLLLGRLVHTVPLTELLRLLLLVVIAIAAVRDGWRGAILAILAVSIAVAVDDHLAIGATNPIQLQLFIAIAGAMGLMFGAAIDDLRRQRGLLDIAQTNATSLAGELAAAAAGNLRTEERERHRIAGDLHDEFGQNLTALQTHLRLMQDDFHEAGKGAALDQLMELTRAMRYNIRDVLERLRPAALDELGLYAAIDRGSIRHLADDAGLRFEVELLGDARLLPLLDDSHRIAAYRLVQEAVTNAVRHAHASRCGVRLRIERRNERLCLFLDVRDDGIGRSALIRPGTGFTTMRDRVTALGGRLHLRDLQPGLRVHAMLRQEQGD